MNFPLLMGLILGSYLIGSLSLSRIVTKIAAPESNLEKVEFPDQNTGGTYQLKRVGATTASMVLGPKWGGLIGILDILKGVIPTLLVRILFPDQPYFLFVGAAVVLGHIYPIYYRFIGGGGLSPALGVMFVIDPLGALVSILLAFVLGLFILREVSVMFMGGPIIFIFWIALLSRNWFAIIVTIFINLLLFLAIWPHIHVYLKAKKDGKTDFSSSMDSIPMGQMMKKMMIKFGQLPNEPTVADDEDNSEP